MIEIAKNFITEFWLYYLLLALIVLIAASATEGTIFKCTPALLILGVAIACPPFGLFCMVLGFVQLVGYAIARAAVPLDSDND